MELETQLSQKFTCPKCNNTGAETDSFAATGTGFARFFDVQNKRFITVSCSNCGYTEVYNQRVLKSKTTAGDVLDFIFGG